ncbi:MAG: MBL fold metallo-hydrolase [Bacteroidales bacterium]|jgi:7,8-dihydropterin-6-yl-methyl-4-(beta-D-ribofuranosyl)aminobenzene 5'-phosphate synthase|nr:MBL fold metallo-hydrolase [Bacteroidales bacterium]
MEIIFLIDNRLYDKKLFSEHGLSILIKTDAGKTILCDTGLSGRFADNAEKLGEDLQKTDFAVISHGHNDHIGGLERFLQTNGTAPVYMSDKITGSLYYSSRGGKNHKISIDTSILESTFPERIVKVEKSRWLSEDTALVFNTCYKYPEPAGNKFLTAKSPKGTCEYPDDFLHEMSLVFRTPKGIIIISPCSHNGILNIAESCRKFAGTNDIFAFIGGFHLPDGGGEKEKDLAELSGMLEKLYPEMLLYTGHCTGETALSYLSESLHRGMMHEFYTGLKIFWQF